MSIILLDQKASSFFHLLTCLSAEGSACSGHWLVASKQQSSVSCHYSRWFGGPLSTLVKTASGLAEIDASFGAAPSVGAELIEISARFWLSQTFSAGSKLACGSLGQHHCC